MTENQSLFPDTDEAATRATQNEPLYVHLGLTDPEVVAALSEYPAGPPRNEFAATCMKVGVLALRAARGVVDGGEIKAAGDHLISQLAERLTGHRTGLEQNIAAALAHYFDPGSGVFSSRVADLTQDDGALARLIAAQVTTAQQGMASIMDKFVGENSAFLALLEPTESNRLLSAMRETVGDVMDKERNVIMEQFSLDQQDGALSRLVRELKTSHGELTQALGTRISDVIGEFSLDRPDSALSRLVGRVEEAQQALTQEFSLDNKASALSRLGEETQRQLDGIAKSQAEFHREVVGMLSAMNARKSAESRSTTHGAVFEEAVGDALLQLGGPAGDIIEAVGQGTGVIRNSRVGDFVATLSPDSAAAGARIVIEAKESASYTLKSTLDEADEARRNRSAGICLFVHSARTAPAGLELISRYGNDVVIVYDPETPDGELVFRAGYLTAKALSMRVAQRTGAEAASFQKVERAIEVIRKTILGFDELKTSTDTIQNSSIKMLDRLRIMRNELERQIETVALQFVALKETSDAAGEA